MLYNSQELSRGNHNCNTSRVPHIKYSYNILYISFLTIQYFKSREGLQITESKVAFKYHISEIYHFECCIHIHKYNYI